MKKILIVLAMSALIVGAQAQSNAGRLLTLYNPLGTNLASDTVTNTATNYLTSRANNGSAYTTTVQVNATKISGTVAGTISLLGSVDGVNFKAATIVEAATALTTYTATDVASQTFIWRINGSPYTYYRVSWTGTGTMSASFNGKVMSH